MKTLFLRPMDVWMFRDGRPFDAGGANRAESIFPPYPSVIQGSIRTHRILSQKGTLTQQQIANLVGTADDYLKLEVRGPFVAKLENGKATRYYPQPADAIIESGPTLKPASLSDLELFRPNLRISHPTTFLLGYQDLLEKWENDKHEKGKSKQKEPLWLSETALDAYHQGSAVPATRQSDLFQREDRLGIGIENSTRVVQEGMLYETEFIRPCKDVGLLIEVGGVGYEDFPNSGVLQLGGESRSAWFETVNADPLPNSQKGTRGIKVYFITPAYFENGWESANWSELFGQPVELKAAAVGRYESVGGFDRASKDTHKPAQRYIPAGSVYYFEYKNEYKNIGQLTDSEKLKQIGFGQIIIKEW
jgi:CRISPR-associated protein Cmr3